MGLIDLSGMFVAVVVADLRGNDRTRPWTRRAFVFSVFAETGLLVAGASTLANIADASTQLVGGLL